MTSPRLRFTRHARNRLRLWKLVEADVVLALADPERITSSVSGRRNAWRRHEGRWLRISYRDDGAEVVVITVTMRRAGPEEE